MQEKRYLTKTIKAITRFATTLQCQTMKDINQKKNPFGKAYRDGPLNKTTSTNPHLQ